MTVSTILKEAKKLSKSEQIRLANRLWKDLDDEPVPSWLKKLLDRRMEEYKKNPARARPWQEVEKSLRRLTVKK
jgi:putative addiction module component (TIGR02574 family)